MIETGYLMEDDHLESAKAYVINNYSVERLVRDTEKLYATLLHEKQLVNGPSRKREAAPFPLKTATS